MKLSPKAFGLTCGTFWGVSLFLSTLVAVKTGYMAAQLDLLVGLYPWYSLTGGGAVVGLVEGFVDGFVGGYLFAWLYNWFACCGSGCCETKGMAMNMATPAKAVAKKAPVRKAAPKRKPVKKVVKPRKK